MNRITRHQVDVVVVGGGGAGLAAALEAKTMSDRVVLLEKNPHLGGSTLLSVGSITACCTPFQGKKGIEDSPEEFYEDMGRFAGPMVERDNFQLRRLYVEKSAKTLNWLMQMGIQFFGPMPEPPNRYPRMHNAIPNSKAYIYNLSHQARKLGVDIRRGIRANRLLTSQSRVSGVEATEENGEVIQFIATGGVVLATGDYSSSRELKETYISPEVADIDGNWSRASRTE